MPNNPFVILGVAEDATQNEILESYKTKRAYYQEHVFDEGESGANAAKMIEQLDIAYQQAMEMAMERNTVSGEGESSTYSDVRQALEKKDFQRAQQLLDDITYRDGDWHYYQAVIFYNNNWINDSKKQLEIALQLDPGNEKYQRTLERLNKKADGSRPYKENTNSGDAYTNNAPPRTERTYSTNQPDATDGCCAACQALWCADCCCECLGGDLIRCC